MVGPAGRDEQNAIEPEPGDGLLRHDEVPVVDRIEGPPEDPDAAHPEDLEASIPRVRSSAFRLGSCPVESGASFFRASFDSERARRTATSWSSRVASATHLESG